MAQRAVPSVSLQSSKSHTAQEKSSSKEGYRPGVLSSLFCTGLQSDRVSSRERTSCHRCAGRSSRDNVQRDDRHPRAAALALRLRHDRREVLGLAPCCASGPACKGHWHQWTASVWHGFCSKLVVSCSHTRGGREGHGPGSRHATGHLGRPGEGVQHPPSSLRRAHRCGSAIALCRGIWRAPGSASQTSGEGPPLSWRPSAVADAGNGRP
jgi:hypothetical protein